jgi:D-alanine-D-alanine ligase
VPAPLDALTTERLVVLARRAFEALGVAGYGRADFRVTAEGRVYFLEMNPLPTLDPRERDLYAAAAAIGKSPRELLSAIIDAAAHGADQEIVRTSRSASPVSSSM